MDEQQYAMNRRRLLACLSAAGLGSTLMPGALAAVAQDADEITVEMLGAAQRVAELLGRKLYDQVRMRSNPAKAATSIKRVDRGR